MAESSLGREFRLLESVCREALSRGEAEPASRLLTSYRHAAEQKGRGQQREQDRRIAREKARRISRLIADAAKAQTTPPTGDSASPFAIVHARKRRRDPLDSMILRPAQIRAAKEIRTVFESLVRALMPRGTQLNSPRVDRSRTDYDPFSSMPPEHGSTWDESKFTLSPPPEKNHLAKLEAALIKKGGLTKVDVDKEQSRMPQAVTNGLCLLKCFPPVLGELGFASKF